MEESKQKTIVEGYVQQVLELEGEVELVESVFSGRNTVKVFIYRPDGVTIEDCVRINRRLTRELEHDEDLPVSLSIEVSSPGLDRRLHSRRDFERVIGEHIRLEVTEENGTKRTIKGLLTDVTEDDLLFDQPEKKKGGSDGEKGPFRVALARVHEGRIEVIF